MRMSSLGRLTLGHPLTFESLGDTLGLFEGCALRYLVNIRVRSICRFSRLLEDCDKGGSNIWAGCPMVDVEPNSEDETEIVRGWFEELRLRLIELDKSTHPIPTSQKLYDEYLKALRNHINKTGCQFCMNAHIIQGEIFRAKLRDISTKTWKVRYPMREE